jgi:glutathione S-transferase
VLVLDGRAIGDSTQIIEALEHRCPEPSLYPADEESRRRALAIEDFFDEELGPYLRLLVLEHMLPSAKLTLGAFFPDLPLRRRMVARALFPLHRRRAIADFGIDDASLERAWAKVHEAGECFREELEPSGYFVGDRFSIADLTLAALVAPVAAPEAFPYPQPQRDHELLAPLRRALVQPGLLEWAQRIYARHRGRSAEIDTADANEPVCRRRQIAASQTT